MHIELEHPEALATAIAALARIAEARHTLPILHHLLLTADQDLHLTATDLTTSLELRIPAQVLTPGAVTVAVRPLKSVALVPDAPVTLEFNPDDPAATFTLRYGSGRLELRTLPCDEFPRIPAMPPATVQLPTATFAGLLRRTAFAISTDAARANLTGLHLIAREGQLQCSATDGHRAIRAQIPTGGTLPGVIVPVKGLLTLTDLAPDSEIGLSVDENTQHLHAACGPERHLAIKRIDGEFPNLDQVFAGAAPPHEIRVKRGEFQDALRRLQPVAGDKYGIALEATNGHLTLTAKDEQDEATDTLDVTITGTPPAIGFNTRYLLDLLDAVDSEDIRLGLTDALSPSRLEPTNDPTLTHVVMPMRI